MKISILGCGWLGLPLAKTLLENGHSVKGSVTSENKILLLKEAGIDPYLIALNENSLTGEVDFFLDSGVLIISIPPKLRGSQPENFVSKIRNLIPFIEKFSIAKVIFISSTAVYSDETIVATEGTPLYPETESGKQLAECESFLNSNQNFKTTILRFGGLVGESRHPVNFLAGKSDLKNPFAPINLIHREDCIAIILSILKNNFWNQTLNAVAPFHPTRKEYYTAKALQLNLDLPEFDLKDSSTGKIVSSKKLTEQLHYKFIISENI